MGMGCGFGGRAAGQRDRILIRPVERKTNKQVHTSEHHKLMHARYPGGKRHYKPWTPQEEELILKHTGDTVALSRQLERSWSAIRRKRKKLRQQIRKRKERLERIHDKTQNLRPS